MNWLQVVGAFINGVIVALIVQGLAVLKPIFIEKWPWAWTLLGSVLGLLIPILANWLTSVLGIPINLNPILAVFSGAIASMLILQNESNKKIKELRLKAGLDN
jgi:hypothetical protein